MSCRLQCGNGRIQECQVHHLGRRRTAENPTTVETLLFQYSRYRLWNHLTTVLQLSHYTQLSSIIDNVDSFKLGGGTNFGGLWLCFLILGDVISWMHWSLVLVRNKLFQNLFHPGCKFVAEGFPRIPRKIESPHKL